MAIIKHIAIHRSPLKLIRYILNGNKTDEMKLATGLNCTTDPESAYEEMGNTFERFAKERFCKKSLNDEKCGKEKIRLHHYIQSFKPNEITPEQAHRIGVEWAEKVFGKNHQVLVTTHTDRQHIHNHFAVAAYDLNGKRWYDNKSTLQRCRDISDKICAAHGLSIIEKPTYRANKKYSDWLARQKNVSWKTRLCDDIDKLILRENVQSVDDLAEQLRQMGYTVTLKKYMSIKTPHSKKAIRSLHLGDGYGIEELQYRILERQRREQEELEQAERDFLLEQKILQEQKQQVRTNGTYYRSSVRNEKKWQECVRYSVDRQEPIDIVYPQFCVIPNAPKRYTNSGYTAGEDCTIEFFRQINEHVKEIYAPGVRFHALADAALYASAFQTPQVEVDEYYDSLNKRIIELKANDFFFLYDYAELLRESCQEEFKRLYYKYSHEVWSGHVNELLPNTDIDTLWRSVRCSVNTRRFQLKHEDHLKLFGPKRFQDANNSFYSKLEELTNTAFNEVVSIRLACTEIDIASRRWPNAIRATCHKGEKNGHWPIGLKTYPEYYGSCKLLPYHGMPLINKNKRNKIRLEIYPEVLLRGRKDLIRVTIGNTDEVYMYILDEIEYEYNGEMAYSTPTGMRRCEF